MNVMTTYVKRDKKDMYVSYEKSKGVLDTASHQLMSRPDDEIFPDIDSLIAHLEWREAITESAPFQKIEVVSHTTGVPVALLLDDTEYHPTHYSWTSVCQLAGAPPKYINTLSPELASRCLNYGIARRADKMGQESNVALTSGDTVRAFYSDKYSRLPDVEVAKCVRDTAYPLGYRPAGEFAGKRGGLAPVKPEATGLYASDRDIFLFLANEEGGFEIDGDTFYHSLIVTNSEGGVRRVSFISALYRYICGNYLIWDAKDILQVSGVHRGDTPYKVLDMMGKVLAGYDQYRRQMAEVDRARIIAARTTAFADTPELAAERLHKEYRLPKKQSEVVLKYAADDRGYPQDPLSVFGIAQGMTLASQTNPYMDSRFDLDVLAGRVLHSVGF